MTPPFPSPTPLVMRSTQATLFLSTVSALILGASPALVGCGGEPEQGPGTEKPADEHEGHDHAPGEGHDDHEGEDDGTHLGTITAAGTRIKVEIHGDITPGEEAHLDLVALSGPDPENVRGWIGLESGVGAMKGKAEPASGGYHLHAEAPAEITADMKVWIEVEPTEGARETQGVPLKAN